MSRGCLLKRSPGMSRLPVALMVPGQCGSPGGTQPGRTEASSSCLCWMQSERKTMFTDSEGDVGVHRCSGVCALLWTHLVGCGRHWDMLLFVSGSLWVVLGVGGGSQPQSQQASTEVFDQRLGTEPPYLCTKYVVWSVWVSQAARGLAPCEDTGRICAGVSCRGGAIRDFCRACQFKFR